jgi:hypothetical protein
MGAAPQENVKRISNDWGWYETDTGTVYYPIPNGRQLLYFEDIASIPDLEERLSAEEAKRQEVLKRNHQSMPWFRAHERHTSSPSKNVR